MSTDFQPQKARRALDVLAAAQDQNWDLLDRDVRQLVLQHRSGPIWCFSTKGSDVSEAKRLNEAEAEAFLAKRGYKPASGLETQIRSLLRLHREPERVLDALDALFPPDVPVRLLEKGGEQNLTIELPIGVRLVVRRSARIFDPELRWSAVERAPVMALDPSSAPSVADAMAPVASDAEPAVAARTEFAGDLRRQMAEHESAASFESGRVDSARVAPEPLFARGASASVQAEPAYASGASASVQAEPLFARGASASVQAEPAYASGASASVQAEPAYASGASASVQAEPAFVSGSPAPAYVEPTFSTRIPPATGDAAALTDTTAVKWGATSRTPNEPPQPEAQPYVAVDPASVVTHTRTAQAWGKTHGDAPPSNVQHAGAEPNDRYTAQQATLGESSDDATADAWADAGVETEQLEEVSLGPTWRPASQIPLNDEPQKKFPIGLIFLSWVFFVIFPLGLNWFAIAILWGFYFWKNRSKG